MDWISFILMALVVVIFYTLAFVTGVIATLLHLKPETKHEPDKEHPDWLPPCALERDCEVRCKSTGETP